MPDLKEHFSGFCSTARFAWALRPSKPEHHSGFCPQSYPQAVGSLKTLNQISGL
ncbi:MAG: hypothetical protein ACK5O3_03135 [Burkholderiales bacterium]